MREWQAVVIGTAAVVGLVVSAVAMDRSIRARSDATLSSEPAQPPVATRRVEWAEATSGGHSFGDSAAVVTIVEFADFECPACDHFWKSALHGAILRYPGRLRVIFRHWPLPYHERAYPAARALECAAADGKAAAMHDALYQSHDTLAKVDFVVLARQVGVAMRPSVLGCLSDTTRIPAVEADIRLAQAIGGRGTPTLVINGRLVRGVPDSARLERLIQDAEKGALKVIR